MPHSRIDPSSEPRGEGEGDNDSVSVCDNEKSMERGNG